MKNEQFIALSVILVFFGFLVFMYVNSQKKTDTTSQIETSQSSSSEQRVVQLPSPAMKINKNKTYTATLTTSEGVITIALNAKETPITVNNFVDLAKKKFYNNTIFHRVIKGFMIQGGDPEGTGRGGPGYKFDDEKFEGDYTRGTVAMANAGPNTNGSQFFIMHKDNNLPKNYIIFGKVTKGFDVVDKIAEGAVEAGGEGSTPKKPVTVESVTISEE